MTSALRSLSSHRRALGAHFPRTRSDNSPNARAAEIPGNRSRTGPRQHPEPRSPYRSSVHRSCTDQGTSSRGHAANGFRTIKNREQSLVTDAMVLLSKTLHASWSIGLAAALVAAIPPGRMARAENIVGGAFVAESCRTREEKNATGFADSRYQTIAATAPFSPRKPGNKACQNGPKATNAPNINWVFLQSVPFTRFQALLGAHWSVP